MKKSISIIKNIWFGIVTSYKACKKYFVIKCLLMLFSTFASLINLWIWKEILNDLTQEDLSYKSIMLLLFIYFLLKVFCFLTSKANAYINSRYSDEMEFYIEGEMMKKTSRVDLSFFDMASMGDKVRHTRNSFAAMNQTTWLVFDIIFGLIWIVSTLIILCAYKWWIGLLTVLLLVPYMIFNKKYTEKRLKMEKEQLRDNRRKDYYESALFDSNVQFEIKLNDIGDFFLSRYKNLWQKLYRINKKEDIRHQLLSIPMLLLNISGELIVLVVSALDVIASRIGIGDLQYYLSMEAKLHSEVIRLMENTDRILVNDTRLSELRDFMEIKPKIESSGNRIPSFEPKIEFSHVYFKYPGSDEYVLRDCSFTIEQREKVGLIGLNGAGKSTIVKLMFRFYDPESGAIKLDGIDIREYDVYKVRKVFGVLFQDYVTYCLPLREIIALSDFKERFNDEKLRKASAISGFDKVIADWGKGFDSILGRYYAAGGRDLSGGQWQLLGLTRAYFKESNYMILDEPSAALDPISEDRIFEQLYHLSSGKTSVTISHRLSNTVLANRILVISGGRITECGTHAELLRANGEYAKWFNLQAERYK